MMRGLSSILAGLLFGTGKPEDEVLLRPAVEAQIAGYHTEFPRQVARAMTRRLLKRERETVRKTLHKQGKNELLLRQRRREPSGHYADVPSVASALLQQRAGTSVRTRQYDPDGKHDKFVRMVGWF